MFRKTVCFLIVLLALAWSNAHGLAQNKSQALNDALKRLGSAINRAGLRSVFNTEQGREENILTYEALSVATCGVRIQQTTKDPPYAGHARGSIYTTTETIPLDKVDRKRIRIEWVDGWSKQPGSTGGWEKGAFYVWAYMIDREKTIRISFTGFIYDKKGQTYPVTASSKLPNTDYLSVTVFKYKQDAREFVEAIRDAAQLCYDNRRNP